MRILKFRAWDKDYEKMTYFEDEDYDYRDRKSTRLNSSH